MVATATADAPTIHAQAAIGPGASVRSLSELAYERLLDMLLSGELPAGTILQERRLAVALKISRTPIREALGRLEAEGRCPGSSDA